MTFEHLTRSYLKQRSGMSESTRELSERWLLLFVRYCQRHGLETPLWLTPGHLDDFQQELTWSRTAQGRFYSPNSVDQALRTVRSCLRWASKQGWLLLDPTRDLVLGRPVQPRQRVLSRAEVRQLLDFPDGHTALGLRDRAVLSLFYSAGLSPRQAGALEERNLQDGRLCCSETEDLLLEPELAARLERWRSVRPELLRDPAEPALFIGHTGRRLGPQRLFAIARDAGDQAGLGPGVSPRLLRRSCLEHERDFGQRRHPF